MRTETEQRLLRELEKETRTIRRQKLLKKLWRIERGRTSSAESGENPVLDKSKIRKQSRTGLRRHRSNPITV